MFSGISFISSEKQTWLSHTLEFDSEVRRSNISTLANFVTGEPIYLSFTESSWAGIHFEHWFVTDRTNFFEFGSANLDIHKARVNINTLPRDGYTLDGTDDNTRETIMNEEIRNRMRHVLGMSNYSLCLRNCEHVANYVFRGRWISFQMLLDEGIPQRQLTELLRDASFSLLFPLYTTRVLTESFYAWKLFKRNIKNTFQRYLIGDFKKLVNTFPASIRPHIFNDESYKLYSFIKNNAIATGFDYYLDYEEDTFNVLILGPTGAGKSHLINTFFNKKICESEASFKSVTREVYFVRGRHAVFNKNTGLKVERNIVIADTIGLCDTEWNEEKTLKLIMNRVSSNYKIINAVLVVLSSDRLQPNVIKNIRNVLKWLGYNERTAGTFVFISTRADNLNEDDKKRMGTELKNLLKLHLAKLPNGEEVESILYTGFPPENTLNDITTDRVKDCWNKVVKIMDNPAKFDPIPVDSNRRLCTIL